MNLCLQTLGAVRIRYLFTGIGGTEFTAGFVDLVHHLSLIVPKSSRARARGHDAGPPCADYVSIETCPII